MDKPKFVFLCFFLLAPLKFCGTSPPDMETDAPTDPAPAEQPAAEQPAAEEPAAEDTAAPSDGGE